MLPETDGSLRKKTFMIVPSSAKMERAVELSKVSVYREIHDSQLHAIPLLRFGRERHRVRFSFHAGTESVKVCLDRVHLNQVILLR